MSGKKQFGSLGSRILKWILIIFFAVYTLFPLLWLFVTSLKTNKEYIASPFSWPAIPQLINYVHAWTQANLGHMIINSIIVAFSATILNVFIATMASYALSRFRFRGREIIYALFASGIMVPLNAMMVPYFMTFQKLHLLDSLLALIILYTAVNLPVSTVIIRGFMDSFPGEVEEAAYVDGCGFFGRFFKIFLPLIRTGIVTAATFCFLTCWNEFVYANLLTSSPETKTIQIGIRYFTNQFSTDYVSMYAAIVIAMVPSIVIYMIFQEKIIAGLTAGAVKG